MDPKRILIVVLDNLGDTVMATAVIPALQSFFPQAQIGFWVKEYAAGLFQNQSDVAHVHASDPFWDTSPGHTKGSFSRFLKTIREIRRTHYDAALILNTEWRRSLAVRLAGIPIRVGYDRRLSQIFLTHAFPFSSNGRHITGDHLALVSSWTGKPSWPEKYFPSLPVKNGHREKLVVIHPFSGDPLRKNWPIENWSALLENLSQSAPGFSFVVVGAKNDAPQMSRLANGRTQLFIDRPLPELMSLLAQARLFVGGDSGPGHIAAAVGTPVVSLFGAFNPDRCRPLGPNTTVLRHDPLKDLSVTMVEDTCKKILSS